MGKYSYRAKNQEGQKIAGEIEAVSQYAASKVLISKKLFPIEINEFGRGGFALEKLPLLSFLARTSRKKKAIAIRQLSTLINAGLPIAQSLDILAKESINTKIKEVFTDVLLKVEGGSSLADAFAAHKEFFTGLDISLATAGEKSGNLDQVLKRMANQLENEFRLISKVRMAMIYPALLFTVSGVVIVVMVTYVVPKLSDLYADFKGEIPAITQFMLSLSNFFVKYWWAVILIVISFIAGFRFLKNTPSGRRNWDYFKIKIPAVKNLLIKIYLARFTRTLSTLIGSGVPVLDALKITSTSVGNVIYEEEILKMIGKIRGGDSLSHSVSDSYPGIFPSVTAQMIKVGEQTGEVDAMLDNLANYYEEEVDNATTALSTLLEPLMVVVMGGVVLFILLAIMVPIYTVSNVIFK